VDSILPSLTIQEHQSLQKERPASATAYEIYLQANEVGRQWENIPTAIEMYERCVSIDPSYASAWARLGRARWLGDKYQLGSLEGLRAAEEAFQTALRLNPNLTLAHNFYTHVQVDQGRSLDAMKRLLDRAGQRRSDAELFAGLAHVCRYCGLLQPALVAHQEARRLDPLIPTSVMHTYFMLGEYERALETSGADFGYGKGIVLTMLGRVEEAVSLLRQCELAKPLRLGKLFLTSLRAFLEGNREEGREASAELMKATFRDPEGMYYMARQFSYFREEDPALEMLSRAIDNGFFCHQTMVRDPWLDALRARPEFTDLLRKAHQLQREASAAFLAGGGPALLGIRSEGY
jgi:tetratricopeptide (TPR) repeat protein